MLEKLNFNSFSTYVEDAVKLGREFHKSIGVILDKAGENDKIQHIKERIEPEPISVREFIGKGYGIDDIKYILKEEYYGYLFNVKFYIKELSSSSFGPQDEVFDIFKIEFDVKNNKEDTGVHFEKRYEQFPKE